MTNEFVRLERCVQSAAQGSLPMCPSDANSFEGGSYEVARPHTAPRGRGPLRLRAQIKSQGTAIMHDFCSTSDAGLEGQR